MEYNDFHIHTKYTKGNSTIEIKDLVARAKVFKMRTLTITDSGNIDGYKEFTKECLEAGIIPFYGIGLYYAPLGLENSETNHLVLIAKNLDGLKNIVDLSKYERVDYGTLSRYSKGVIALSGGLGGVFDKPYFQGNEELGLQNIKILKELFGSNFYLEIQDNGLNENLIIMERITNLAFEYKLEIIVTGGAFYLYPNDFEKCNNLRLSFGNKQLKGSGYYFKGPKEIEQIFNKHLNGIYTTEMVRKQIDPDLFKSLDVTTSN
ncbi:MAG: PHP domain-containing protein [Spirochaetales bacterium]|nr:PHP domain-containing protein [Spirochaetales bacterium]